MAVIEGWQPAEGMDDRHLFFLYFVDRASRYKFLLITNLKHFFMYLAGQEGTAVPS